MLRRLGVRGKILATLAVPIFVLVLTASWITWQSLQGNREAEQTAALMDSLELQDSAGSAVANERALSIAASSGLPGARKALVQAQEMTVQALDARDDALGEVDTSALSANVQDAVQRTLDDRGTLDEVQRKVIAGQVSEQRATEQYTELIDDALALPRSIAQTSTDTGLARRIEAYTSLDEVMLANTLERPIAASVLAQVANDETPSADMINRMVSSLQDTDDLFADAQQNLDQLPGDLRVPAYEVEFNQLRTQLKFVTLSGIDPEAAGQWPTLSQDWVDATQPVRDDVRAMAVGYAGDQADQARVTAILTGVGAFGIVLLSFLLALAISRRIVNPLRRLTTATAEVRDRLPQMVDQMAVPGQAPAMDLVQVPVESSDEVGRLAAAFNEVNETTMVVAREQAALRGSIAEMFVNVARRDQVLLNRQLSFLDDLERSEEDPSTLSNLFRLDHLATRMRRNAESLLVLAGIDSGRRVRNPMPLSDVVRTASSEIEFYDRVRLELGVDPHMLGHNALNAAHLLAELVENATMFSEPHTPVEVVTSRDERGVVVVVRDHGLGMSADELADANHKVTSTAASEAVGAQRLGMFVVGRLAERLGSTVTFMPGASGSGTEVSVAFPAVLFLPDEAMPLPQPTDPLEVGAPSAATGLSALSSYEQPEPVVDQPAAFTSATSVVPTVEAPEPVAVEPVPAPAASYAPAAAEEPPAAVPVDLDALTDGTTSVGMPRRRRSDAGDGRADTGPIILAPLETPTLPDLGDESTADAWRPPSPVEEPTSSALPSRHRASGPETTSTPVEPAPVSAPVLGVAQRAGLFSSFRSMESLDSSPDVESTLQLDAVTEDPAAVPAAFVPPAEPRPAPAPVPAPVMTPEPVVPQPVVQEPERVAPEPAAPLPVRGAATPGAALPVAPAEPQERPEPRQEQQEQPAPVVREVDTVHLAEPQARTTQHPVFDPVPAAMSMEPQLQVEPEAPAQPERDALESLPAFEDLMSGLPTRRGARESASQARKRGLFGRRPSEEGAGGASASAPTPSSPVASSTPWATAPAPAAPAASAPRVASEVRDDVRRQEPVESRASMAYGGSVLPLRSTDTPGGDALDPHFVPDTVEARSEWMASAVLYEEMSALLQRGVFQEGNVTPTNDEQTYRPTTVAGAGSGLVRRKRQGDDADSGDRFTARIERDPEQLRSRLSSFQSATNRGRTDARRTTPSTATPTTVNDVPGSTPQSR